MAKRVVHITIVAEIEAWEEEEFTEELIDVAVHYDNTAILTVDQ